MVKMSPALTEAATTRSSTSSSRSAGESISLYSSTSGEP
jgi:hypothetical protein